MLATCLLFFTLAEAQTNTLSTTISTAPTHTDTHEATHTDAVDTRYTVCYPKDNQIYCTNAQGEEVLVGPAPEDEQIVVTECGASKIDYNKKLRIGAIFIVLVTSSICKSPFLHYLE